MSTAARRPYPATLSDWLSQPHEARLELIDGIELQVGAFFGEEQY